MTCSFNLKLKLLVDHWGFFAWFLYSQWGMHFSAWSMCNQEITFSWNSYKSLQVASLIPASAWENVQKPQAISNKHFLHPVKQIMWNKNDAFDVTTSSTAMFFLIFQLKKCILKKILHYQKPLFCCSASFFSFWFAIFPPASLTINNCSFLLSSKYPWLREEKGFTSILVISSVFWRLQNLGVLFLLE